tara:strand:- start:24695 stop:24889 length:195 start_codon:yes stop_codon:yes gene_type:complete
LDIKIKVVSLHRTFKTKIGMLTFLGGIIVGAIGLFLVLDNNPKLAAKLKTVKNIVKQKIEDSKK